LLGWITRFFQPPSRHLSKDEAEVADAVFAPSFSLNGGADPTASDVDCAFLGLTLGVSVASLDGEMSQAEKVVLDNLRNVFLKQDLPDNLVPRLPAVMPRIMMAIRDQNASAEGLARSISGDIALVGEVIRLANSPYYRTAQPIESLEQAIVMLGINGIRQLIASAAFKPILNAGSGHFVGNASHYLWEKNLKAGQAGDCIARSMGADRFHAYLSGLIGQAGIAVAMKQLDQQFTEGQTPGSASFMNELSLVSRQITVRIARHWDLPGPVLEALEDQISDREPEDMSSMGGIAFMSDKLAKMHILSKNGQLQDYTGKIHCRLPGAMNDACSHCYRLIAEP
jgi:HD-like signal output (HDOD) protein